MNLVFDPPDTTYPTHRQRLLIMSLVGRKGDKAYRECSDELFGERLDISTATQAELTAMIALMSYYPDLEDRKWKRRKKHRRK